MSTEEVDLKLKGEEDLGYIKANLGPWVKIQLNRGKKAKDLTMPEDYRLNVYKIRKKFVITHGSVSVILSY